MWLNLMNSVHKETLPLPPMALVENRILKWTDQTLPYTDISNVVLSKLKNSNTQVPSQGVWCCGKSIRCWIQQNYNYENLGEFFYFSHTPTPFSQQTLSHKGGCENQMRLRYASCSSWANLGINPERIFLFPWLWLLQTLSHMITELQTLRFIAYRHQQHWNVLCIGRPWD